MTAGFGRSLARGVLALALGGLGSAQAAVPDGTPLLIYLPPEALPSGEGANGFVTVGGLYSGGAFHWMPTSGVTGIGGRQAVAVSASGKVIVGNALDPRGFEQAAIWQGARAGACSARSGPSAPATCW